MCPASQVRALFAVHSAGPMAILIPILQGLRLFESLPAARLRELSQAMSERRVERREVVIKRGDRDAGLGFLIEGRLQTVDFTLDGREVGIDFVDERDFFGELAVIDHQPAPEYVIAVAPSCSRCRVRSSASARSCC